MISRKEEGRSSRSSRSGDLKSSSSSHHKSSSRSRSSSRHRKRSEGDSGNSAERELLDFLKKSNSNRNLAAVENKDDEKATKKKKSTSNRKSSSSSSSTNKDPEANKFEMALCVWQYLKTHQFHFTADTMQQEWTKINKGSNGGGSLNKANFERIQLELAFKSSTTKQDDDDDNDESSSKGSHDDDDDKSNSSGSEEGSGDESSEDEKEEAKKKAMLGRPQLGGSSTSHNSGRGRGDRRPSMSRAGSVSKIEMQSNLSSSSSSSRRPSLAGSGMQRTQSERNMRTTTATSMYPSSLIADDADDDEDDTGLDYGKPHTTAPRGPPGGGRPSLDRGGSVSRLGGPSAGQNQGLLGGRTQSERKLKTRIQQETEYQSLAAEEMIKMMNDSLSDLYKNTVMPSPSLLKDGHGQAVDLDPAKYAGPTLTFTNQVAQNAKKGGPLPYKTYFLQIQERNTIRKESSLRRRTLGNDQLKNTWGNEI